jgi:hypothetical protein
MQGVFGDHVTADELHRRILIGGLLPEDRTGEHTVVTMLLADVDFDGQFIFGQDVTHLRVLHSIDDTENVLVSEFDTLELRTRGYLISAGSAWNPIFMTT